MAKGCQDKEGFAENLREKLAVSVRNIEWCYAIFWSISSSQPGVLEWGDGYYNGDIKTRKTVQTTEISGDQLGLQRTEHLRELYESLLAGEANSQPKLHSAALSPEDLTDTEWYFLVCMSFVFNIGQGLPGRALSKNQTIWLCNAHQADSRIFTRTLLAKSASIQTVVCFPYSGGIIELGATDIVPKDLNLINCVRTSYLDKNDKAVGGKKPGQDRQSEDNNIGSPFKNSNGFGANQEEGDSIMVEEMNGEASQLQSWKLVDDDISNCVVNSTNSSDCISQNYVNPERVSTLSEAEKINSHSGLGVDVRYQSILSNVLKSSHQLVLGPHCRNVDRESSFGNWKKEIMSSNKQIPRTRTPQKLLKKVLLEVAGMHGCSVHDSLYKPEAADETDRSRVLSERRRREKLNERFMTLASLIPASGKVDKISILDETIEYLKDLERRVKEAESQKERLDNAERTSDNCGAKSAEKGKNTLPQKRKKANDMEENSRGNHKSRVKNDVTVSMIGKDVTVEMKCLWNEGMLMKIIEALNNLHLDCYGIQSSNGDGILSVTIKAKMEETKAISMSLIRHALQKLTQAS